MANNSALINLIEEKFKQTNKNIESMQIKIQNDIATIYIKADYNSNRIDKIVS